MTILGHMITFFPVIHLIAIMGTLIAWVNTPSIFSFTILIFAIYAFPIIVYRIHNIFFPLRECTSNLSLPIYSPWWASHQFQAIFNGFPALEVVLKLIPGVYSAWIRLWGGQIGKNVYWTQRVEIIDRGLIEVGNHVIFGHKVIICSHVVHKKNGSLRLYVKKVRIGNNAFIGAGSKLGPGSEILADQIIPFETTLTINKKW